MSTEYKISREDRGLSISSTDVETDKEISIEKHSDKKQEQQLMFFKTKTS